eukprot:CAMPEP_0185444298 /NCGR_PEP_ID=MMETSP1365-20130426/49308_1 /TAXON_ID=38817 /ORGANISM="Gephyrocapsa oceanica, Strain RCC1303" /LENGTH=349 /DNA_ID=CAMNT_0028049969 /DNA_START=129 /DNA_END=1179 /DNA_ORIENTATION=+
MSHLSDHPPAGATRGCALLPAAPPPSRPAAAEARAAARAAVGAPVRSRRSASAASSLSIAPRTCTSRPTPGTADSGVDPWRERLGAAKAPGGDSDEHGDAVVADAEERPARVARARVHPAEQVAGAHLGPVQVRAEPKEAKDGAAEQGVALARAKGPDLGLVQHARGDGGAEPWVVRRVVERAPSGDGQLIAGPAVLAVVQRRKGDLVGALDGVAQDQQREIVLDGVWVVLWVRHQLSHSHGVAALRIVHLWVDIFGPVGPHWRRKGVARGRDLVDCGIAALGDAVGRSEDQVWRHEAAATGEVAVLQKRNDKRIAVEGGLDAADDARPRLLEEPQRESGRGRRQGEHE